MVEKIKLEVVNTGTAHSNLSINQILSSNFVCLMDTTMKKQKTNKKAQHHEHTSHNLYFVMTAPFFLPKSVCSLH